MIRCTPFIKPTNSVHLATLPKQSKQSQQSRKPQTSVSLHVQHNTIQATTTTMAATVPRALFAACLVVLLVLGGGGGGGPSPAEAQQGDGQCLPQLNRLLACRAYLVPGAPDPSADCCGALSAVSHECACSTMGIINSLPGRCNLAQVNCSA